jgi:hypothetical protein
MFSSVTWLAQAIVSARLAVAGARKSDPPWLISTGWPADSTGTRQRP